MFKFLKGITGNKKGVAKSSTLSTDEKQSSKLKSDLKPFEFNINIDSATAQDNMFVLHGWAYCADTEIERIEIVYKNVTNSAKIGIQRPDVMKTYEHCKFIDTGFHYEHSIDSDEKNRKVQFIVSAKNGKVYNLEFEFPIDHWNPGMIADSTDENIEPPKKVENSVPLKKYSRVVSINKEYNLNKKVNVKHPPKKVEVPIVKEAFNIHVDLSSVNSNMLIIQGWAYCVDSRVKRIEVIYNGESKDAIIEFDREDVQVTIEDCNCPDTGFYFQKYIDYTSTSRGVKFRIYGENDQIFEYNYELPKFKWFPNADSLNRNKEYKRYFSTKTGVDYKRRKELESIIASFQIQPMITVIVPVYNVDVKWMNLAVNSIIDQVYTNWELLLIDDKSTSEPLIEYLKDIDHPQVQVHWCRENGHISKATNIGVGMSKGDYILFMDNDDKLDLTALYEVANAVNISPESDIFYSDEDKIDTKERRSGPVYKPDWSPELLLTTNYFNHILCVKKSLCEQVKFRSEFDGCQDWDFILRLIEITDKVYHIPKVLYNWRTLEGSISRSGSAKEDISFLEKCERAINQHLERTGTMAIATRPECSIESGAALFEINSIETKISDLSIIIYLSSLEGKQLLFQSLVEAAKTGNIEVLVYHDDSADKINQIFYDLNFEQFRLYSSQKKNLVEIYNEAAINTTYSNLLFIDENIEAIKKEILLNLLLFSKRKKIGVLGTKLLESDDIIHSTGYLLGMNNGIFNDLYPSKAFHKESNDYGYFYFKQIVKNYSAVPKEFFFIKKEVFNELNGFDQSEFEHSLFEVDFCLRARQKGYRHVVIPGDTKIKVDKEESFNLKDLKHFYDRYNILNDPFYNPNFSNFDQYDYKLLDRPTKVCQKKNLRLLFCTHNLNFEGAPIHIFEIIEQLLKSDDINFEIEVYSPVDGPLKERYAELGVQVCLVPQLINSDSNTISSELHFDRNLKRIAKWLNSKSYDIVFCNTVLSFEFVLASNIVNIPTVWNIHESTPINSFIKNNNLNFNSRLAEAFDVVSDVVFSSGNTANLYKFYLKRNNYSVITNGIKEDVINEFKQSHSKLSVRKELGIKHDNFVFLSLGSFAARKGQMDFVVGAIQMLKSVKSPKELTFVMVGADKDPAKFSYTYNINSLIEKSGFKENFMVLPVVSDINNYYFASDVFVCSSYNESSPRVILIAMLFDLPIITTPVYGIKDQVIENHNALYYEPGDLEKLSLNMELLLDNKSLLERLAKNSKIVLSLSNSHKQMVQAYTDIIVSAG